MENKLKQLIKSLTADEKSELKRMLVVDNDYQYIYENIIKRKYNELRRETVKELNQLKSDVESLIDQKINSYHQNEMNTELQIIDQLLTNSTIRKSIKNNTSSKYLEKDRQKQLGMELKKELALQRKIHRKNKISELKNLKARLSKGHSLPKEIDKNLLYEKTQKSFDDFLKEVSE